MILNRLTQKNEFTVDFKNWTNKRWKILHRDNYTCQRCKTFNPQLGTVEIYDASSNTSELHEYETSPAYSLYRITSVAL